MVYSQSRLLTVPSSPNVGDGNLSEENFHGFSLVAFGTNHCVVISRKDTMAVVQVEEVPGYVHAVRWGGIGGAHRSASQRTTNESNEALESSRENWLHGEEGAPRKGCLVVAADDSVVILLPSRDKRSQTKSSLPFSWRVYYSLGACRVTQLVWSPVSDILITCSTTGICGWSIALPQQRSWSLSNGAPVPVQLISHPVWQIQPTRGVHSDTNHPNMLCTPSVTYDGVSFPPA